MQPLKMILSKSCGHRFQMDLIEMPPCGEHNYILRVVDHLSKFGYVHPLKSRTSLEVGNALVTVIATSMTPRILQSDNGGEVCVDQVFYSFYFFSISECHFYNSGFYVSIFPYFMSFFPFFLLFLFGMQSSS